MSGRSHWALIAIFKLRNALTKYSNITVINERLTKVTNSPPPGANSPLRLCLCLTCAFIGSVLQFGTWLVTSQSHLLTSPNNPDRPKQLIARVKPEQKGWQTSSEQNLFYLRFQDNLHQYLFYSPWHIFCCPWQFSQKCPWHRKNGRDIFWPKKVAVTFFFFARDKNPKICPWRGFFGRDIFRYLDKCARDTKNHARDICRQFFFLFN